MKPSFALSLSFEGIRLLHRAAGGWRVVGAVGLDDPDMGAALAALHSAAERLAPDGIRAKVLLPNEQIKYLSIDTPGADDAARRTAAQAALDGATPYAVADLAYDISVESDKTHIAAVAKETLAEAESFARQYHFNPVSFAAAPGEEAYLGEPFFGMANDTSDLLAPGETVEPDGIAVVVIGDVLPETAPKVAVTEVTPLAPPTAPPPEPEPPAPEITAPPPVAEPIVAPEAAPPAVGFASRRAPERQMTPELGGVTRAAEPASEPAVLGAGAITAGSIEIEPDPPEAPPPPETGDAPPAPVRSGFLSRRRAKAAPPPPKGEVIPAAPPPIDGVSGTEKDRMTVFGARKVDVGGKPRFLGLFLTAALLVFLAGVAAWASVFLDDGLRLSRLFGERTPAPTFADAVADDLIASPQTEAPQAPEIVTASLDPSLSEEDAAVLDALRAPETPEGPPVLSDGEVAARYAATGIWPVAPVTPPEPANPVGLDDLYLTSIDPVSTASDAIALPAIAAYDTDASLALVSSPAAAGTVFALDAAGLVIPTVEGALSPEGFTVYLGRPDLVPPTTPVRFQSEPEDTAIRSALAAARPQPRPADLVENTERATLGGLTRSELADIRPALRPKSLQEQAAVLARQEAEAEAAAEAARVAAEEPAAQDTPTEATDGAVALALAAPAAFENATRNAVQASIRPDVRPRNFARIVKRAQRNTENQEVRVASAAAVAPRVVTPKIPTRTSVAKQATVRNAINLRKINLIGVYGKPSSRRALVRLGNGRYRKVEVGDRIDGGRVSAIGDSQLRYNKRGRDVVLKMP